MSSGSLRRAGRHRQMCWSSAPLQPTGPPVHDVVAVREEEGGGDQRRCVVEMFGEWGGEGGDWCRCGRMLGLRPGQATVARREGGAR
jgi:hypothetical protein